MARGLEGVGDSHAGGRYVTVLEEATAALRDMSETLKRGDDITERHEKAMEVFIALGAFMSANRPSEWRPAARSFVESARQRKADELLGGQDTETNP